MLVAESTVTGATATNTLAPRVVENILLVWEAEITGYLFPFPFFEHDLALSATMPAATAIGVEVSPMSHHKVLKELSSRCPYPPMLVNPRVGWWLAGGNRILCRSVGE